MTEKPGVLLREARQRNAVTQAELARRAGTTQSAISRIENGGVSPTVETLASLLAATGEDLALASRFGPDRAPSVRRVRQAREADASAVIAAYEWLFAPPGSRPPGYREREGRVRLEAAIADPLTAVLVCELDGSTAGFATVYLTLKSVRYGQRAWVEDLAVDPARRSRGIGADLLSAAREWASAQGAQTLELESGDQRIDAHRFYEQQAPGWRSRSYGWSLSS